MKVKCLTPGGLHCVDGTTDNGAIRCDRSVEVSRYTKSAKKHKVSEVHEMAHNAQIRCAEGVTWICLLGCFGGDHSCI